MRTRQTAWKASLLYALAATGWLAATGLLLRNIEPTPPRWGPLEILRETSFVLLSAVGLWWWVRHSHKHQVLAGSEAREQAQQNSLRQPQDPPTPAPDITNSTVAPSKLQPAEASFRESEAEFRALFESAAIGMAEADPATGIFLRVNSRMCAITGYSPEEMRHLRFSEITHPDDRQRNREMFLRVMRGDQPEYCTEKRYLRKDGSIAWGRVNLAVIRDPVGTPLRGLATVEDISDRKRAEAFQQVLLSLGAAVNLVRNSTAAARALLAAADQLWRWDAASLNLLAEDGVRIRPLLLVDILDGERAEVPLLPEAIAASPRVRRVMEEGPQLILRDAAPAPAPDAVPFGDKQRFSASAMCVPLRCEHRIVGMASIQSYARNAYTKDDLRMLQVLADFCGAALDRIRAEEALQKSEERYRGLIQTSFDWIWEVDAEARCTYTSPRVEALLGYSPQEIVGRTPFEFMVAGDGERLHELAQRLAAKPVPFSGLETTALTKVGRLITIELSGVPMVGPNGEFQGFRGTARDITQRRQLEAELRQAQRLEGVAQLAGGVAHDFNNILTAITLELDLLRQNVGLAPEVRRALVEIEADARRAANLTRQLLLFSRRAALAVRPLDLNQVVENLLKMLHRLIGEDLNLRLNARPSLPAVEADLGMVEQVVMNLVVNARDAMPRGGRIEISTSLVAWAEAEIHHHPSRRAGTFVCLAVADTGCGMDDATLKRIFEPFFTTKPAGQGTGLGLATVHGIVAQHKGWVEVSSAPGLGTTFRVYLPALETAAAAVPPVVEVEGLPGGTEAILLVEDEEGLRRIAATALRKLGYRVIEAANGPEAQAAWEHQAHQIDLLFTDMVMPEGISGLDLTEALQKLEPRLKVILTSGYSDRLITEGALEEIGIRFLPKPYDAKTMAEVVRRCLDEPRGAKC